MTEPATSKPFFTRRRVIAGAAALGVFVVGLSWCAWLMFGRYEGPLAVVFAQFEQRRHTGSGWAAKVYLTNVSDTVTCRLYYPKTFGPEARFFSSFPHDETINVRTNPFSLFRGTLMPHTGAPMSISLPGDGSVGWLAVAYTKPKRPWPRWIRKGLELWERRFPPRAMIEWGVCREKVVCPKKLPDGTIEPPCLVSSPEAKP